MILGPFGTNRGVSLKHILLRLETNNFYSSIIWNHIYLTLSQKKFNRHMHQSTIAFRATKKNRTTFGCFHNSGIPKWMVYNGKPYIFWMIWGYHYFRKHPCGFPKQRNPSGHKVVAAAVAMPYFGAPRCVLSDQTRTCFTDFVEVLQVEKIPGFREITSTTEASFSKVL